MITGSEALTDKDDAVNLIPPLKAPPFNSAHEGEYGPQMMEWRKICAGDKASHILKILGNRAASVSTVLDVGCGTGSVLVELKDAGLGEEHIGIDVDDPGHHLAPGAEVLDLRTYDGSRLPFEDQSFDFAFASHVLEHVLDERELLGELARVAQLVYVEVPCELIWRSNYTLLQHTLNIGHINAYTPQSFGLTLVTSGLDVIDLQAFDHSDAVHNFQSGKSKALIKSSMRRIALKLNPSIAGRMFAYHCGALCVPIRQ